MDAVRRNAQPFKPLAQRGNEGRRAADHVVRARPCPKRQKVLCSQPALFVMAGPLSVLGAGRRVEDTLLHVAGNGDQLGEVPPLIDGIAFDGLIADKA